MRIPSTEIQNNFGKYLKYAAANEEVIVTKNGKDVAKVVACEPSDAGGVMEDAALYRANYDRVTYEEFVELTESSEQRFELIDGVVYNLASPSYKHQYAVSELHAALHNRFKGKQCVPITSPFDVTFFKAEDNICVVQPDLVVICDQDKVDVNDRYRGTPSLAIEVLSPSTRGKDMVTKLDLYKQCGVKEYWIVDPMNEQIHVYALDNNDISNNKSFSRTASEEACSFNFAGLKVALGEVFV
jgi:prevent-host-death family protein